MTSDVGCFDSLTVKVAVPPASVVLPLMALIVNSVVVVPVVLLVVVEDPKLLSFPENPHPEKYIKMGSKKTNNFDLANIRTPFQIQ